MITPSSLPVYNPAEMYPIFGNDGIVYYTRRLNFFSNLHTFFFWFNTIVSLRQLLHCIIYGPTALLLVCVEIHFNPDDSVCYSLHCQHSSLRRAIQVDTDFVSHCILTAV